MGAGARRRGDGVIQRQADERLAVATRRQDASAARHARDIVFDVAAAIARGRVLRTERFTVGPVQVAVGPVVWACLNRASEVSIALEREPRAVFPRAVPFPVDVRLCQIEEREAPDLSAFGAARAFVREVGPAAALRAVDEEDP